ncbi:hypothetical protein [Bartonella bacilliformis]|nr:hypothetical protein [Bartonella bacilliformis]
MVQKLTEWMPDFVKKLDFNVNINKTSIEVIKNFTDETNARAKRFVNATVVSNIPPEQRVRGVQTGTVETQHIGGCKYKGRSF